MADPDRWNRFAAGFALAGSLGFAFLASTLLGAGAGYLADRSLGLRPIVFTLILGTLGAAAGFRMVVRVALRESRSGPGSRGAATPPERETEAADESDAKRAGSVRSVENRGKEP